MLAHGSNAPPFIISTPHCFVLAGRSPPRPRHRGQGHGEPYGNATGGRADAALPQAAEPRRPHGAGHLQVREMGEEEGRAACDDGTTVTLMLYEVRMYLQCGRSSSLLLLEEGSL